MGDSFTFGHFSNGIFYNGNNIVWVKISNSAAICRDILCDGVSWDDISGWGYSGDGKYVSVLNGTVRMFTHTEWSNVLSSGYGNRFTGGTGVWTWCNDYSGSNTNVYAVYQWNLTDCRTENGSARNLNHGFRPMLIFGRD